MNLISFWPVKNIGAAAHSLAGIYIQCALKETIKWMGNFRVTDAKVY